MLSWEVAASDLFLSQVLAQFRQKGRAKRDRDDRELANAFFYEPPEQLRKIPLFDVAVHL